MNLIGSGSRKVRAKEEVGEVCAPFTGAAAVSHRPASHCRN